MKKMISLLILTCIITACTVTQTGYTSYPTDNYKRLTIGMSKWDVEDCIGPPLRYLDARRTIYGYEEVLLYRNRYSEYFALEFVNDYLVSSNYVHNEAWYPMYPSYNRPAYGKPVFPPSYKPNRPYQPPSNVQPGRPTQPGNNSQTPNYDRPPSTTRPSTNTQPDSNSRPSSGTSNSNTRESTQPSSTTRSSSSDSSTQSSSTTRSSSTDTGTTSRESSTERSSNQNTSSTTRGSNTR